MPLPGWSHARTSAARRLRERRVRLQHRLHALYFATEGQALVEFALTVPVLLLVVTGICTFGIAMNQFLLLTEATNVGARQLAVSRGNTTDPCATVSAVVIAAAPLLTPANLSFTYVINGTTYTGTTCTGAVTNMTAAQGTAAKLTVIYSGCNLKVYGANYAPNCSLQAQTSELVQ